MNSNNNKLEDKARFIKDNPIDTVTEFNKLDESKGNLLVDTNNKLLPHFTYLDPNSNVTATYDDRNVKANARLKKSQIKVSKERILEKLDKPTTEKY